MPPGSWNSGASSSPDGDSLLGRQPHRVIFGHTEGFVEGVDVADGLVAAELGGRVGVGSNLGAQGLIALFFAPNSSVRQEEPLLPRQAFNRFGFGSRKGNLEGFEGDSSPAKVPDVLSDGQLAVDVRAVGAELRGISSLYWAMRPLVRSLKAARSSIVHQSRNRPLPSHVEP